VTISLHDNSAAGRSQPKPCFLRAAQPSARPVGIAANRWGVFISAQLDPFEGHIVPTPEVATTM
jgi:hypothetical protein